MLESLRLCIDRAIKSSKVSDYTTRKRTLRKIHSVLYRIMDELELDIAEATALEAMEKLQKQQIKGRK